MMLRGGSAGVVLPRPVAAFTAAGGTAMQAAAPGPAFGGTTSAGRGLDAYRMQPVTIVGPRLIASR
jgi:hypothetical protein